MASKNKKKKIVVDVCIAGGDQTSGGYMVARYQGRWGVLEGPALRKARKLVEKAPDRDIGTPTGMREYGSIEISEDDWVPMP